MRRLTVALDDDLFGELLNYAADRSKQKVRRLSLGEAVRVLLAARLVQVGYRREARKTWRDQRLELDLRKKEIDDAALASTVDTVSN